MTIHFQWLGAATGTHSRGMPAGTAIGAIGAGTATTLCGAGSTLAISVSGLGGTSTGLARIGPAKLGGGIASTIDCGFCAWQPARYPAISTMLAAMIRCRRDRVSAILGPLLEGRERRKR